MINNANISPLNEMRGCEALQVISFVSCGRLQAAVSIWVTVLDSEYDILFLARQKYPRCEHKVWKYRLVLQHLLPPGQGGNLEGQKNAFPPMCFSHALFFPFVIKIYEVMRVILNFFY